nr:MAG TPA: hypothetical protein [Caudoviricetes sp.]
MRLLSGSLTENQYRIYSAFFAEPIGERMAGQAFGSECYIAEMRDVRVDTWCECRKRKRCVYLKESIELRKHGAL